MAMSMIELVSRAAKFGFSPITIRGKKLILLHQCPKCGQPKMIKLVKKPDMRNRVHACPCCGYRKMTPGFVKNNGTFVVA
jgi:predicted RNA-binding Zn-ribbon protein involved in translation (DUF1610 family)